MRQCTCPHAHQYGVHLSGCHVGRKEFEQASWKWRVRVEFKCEDLWIGVYWRKSAYALHIWVCFLPMVPIHFIKRIR